MIVTHRKEPFINATRRNLLGGIIFGCVLSKAVMAGEIIAKRRAEGLRNMEITIRASQSDDFLDIEYTAVNPTEGPILVFDRLHSMDAKKMDADWAYVSLKGGRAWVRRALSELPIGLRHENPEVPYGRQVEAGQTATGKSRLALPLRDRAPYLRFSRAGTETRTMILDLVFTLGWCAAPTPESMPSGIQPFEWEGERLWLFPYDLLRAAQRVTTVSHRLPGVPGLVLQH